MIFSKRVLCSFVWPFTFSRIKGRFNGPKIFANSISRSVTNLVEKVFIIWQYLDIQALEH